MYDRYLVERDVIFAAMIGEAKCTKEMQIERNRYLYVSPRSIKKRTYRCCFAKNGHSLISVNATVCKTTDDFSDFHFSIVFLAVASRRNEKGIYFLLIECWATKKHKRISNIQLSTKCGNPSWKCKTAMADESCWWWWLWKFHWETWMERLIY